jgi:hypothetical protein
MTLRSSPTNKKQKDRMRNFEIVKTAYDVKDEITKAADIKKEYSYRDYIIDQDM